MRAAILIGAGATLALTGCGADPAPPPRPAPVRLTISSPADSAVIRGADVDVEGTVRPAGARVAVVDRPALVTGSRFTVVVPLDPGVNVLDVVATAAGRGPALTAIRVTRDERVTVPDLIGVRSDELAARLASLGLRLRTVAGGGLLDPLIPRAPRACEQDPPGGTRVRRGKTVRVTVARAC